ncbi:MAG: hypothetical protein HDT38_07035 [Clostridiales bacterium]|nr:hypothetical protein [Clostridiales bacterium]
MEFSGTEPASNVPYQKMYTTLFNAVTTALCMMEDNEMMKARAALVQA